MTTSYSGAYTYYRTPSDKLEMLYIWESWLVVVHTPDVGVPAHVIKNDPKMGELRIYTGEGIQALSLMSHGESSEKFEPGKAWKSTWMQLGMDIEEAIL